MSGTTARPGRRRSASTSRVSRATLRRRPSPPPADGPTTTELRDDRLARGLARSPLGVVMTRGGGPLLDAPAFADDEAEVALFTAAPEPLPACPARVHVIRMPPADLTPDVVMRRLPLATLVEAEPLWELAGDARRVVRFRAQRRQG